MKEISIKEWEKLECEPGFNEATGLDRVRVYEDGSFSMLARVNEDMLNPFGTAHGGVLFTLCDNAAGSYMAHTGRASVTLGSNMNFYRAAFQGDELITRVQERKSGKTITVLLIEILNQKGERIADGIFSMYRTDMAIE